MVLDAYDRPFVADLQRRIQRRGEQLPSLDQKVRGGMGFRDIQLDGLAPFGIEGRIAISETADLPTDGAHATFASRYTAQGQQFERLSFEVIDLPSSIGSVEIGVGVTASDVGASPRNGGITSLFVDGGSLLSPTDAIVDRGAGGSLRHAIADHTTLKLGYMDARENVTPDLDTSLPGRVLALGTEHRLGEQTMLDLSYAYVEESEGLLGSDASGAFAFANGTASQFGTARLSHRLMGDVELFAQATLGVSQIDGESSLLSDWSSIRSDAFALGLIVADLAGDGDRFGLMLGQPLRVSSASAILDLPTARTIDGQIERSQERVKMTPRGRELRMEIAYLRPIGDARSLGGWLLVQHQPGHDAEAEPALGIGLRYTGRF
jgi:hypothetical protein